MLHVFKHELRLVFRDPRFWIPFVIPPVILAASQAIAVSHYGGQVMEGMEPIVLRGSANAIRSNSCSFRRLRRPGFSGANSSRFSRSR